MTSITKDKVRKLTEFCIGLSFSERRRGPCERSSPASGRADIGVQNLIKITDGWECDVYSFDLVTPSTTIPLILRMYMDKPESQAAIKCRREFGVMRHLFNAGYPVPEVFGCQTDATCLGAPFVVMQRICGTTLGRVYAGASSKERLRVLDLFTSLFAGLHDLDPAEFDPETASLSTHLIIRKELSEFERYRSFLDNNVFEPAFSWLGANMHQVKPSRPSIIHYDFHAQNILVEDTFSQDKDGPQCVNREHCQQDKGLGKRQNNVFVIDWTQSRVSDFRFDLAWSLLLIGDTEGQAMLESYRRKPCIGDDSPLHSRGARGASTVTSKGPLKDESTGASRDASMSASGDDSRSTYRRSAESLDYFIVFACVRRLASIYGSIKHGADRFGMRPGAEEIMKKQTNHIRRIYHILTGRSGLELPQLESWIAQME
ncbi:MAG TPA: phosphotransferase [Firmicutes bacterium]|nr:phosphotransferase [Candidatus Fermentithermobacillaceae bacterium]